MATLKNGDHAVVRTAPSLELRYGTWLTAMACPSAASQVPYAVYGGTHEFLVQYAQDWGIEYTLVDATDANEYRKALQPNTRVVYTESPANPTCRLTDLEAVSKICDEHGHSGLSLTAL